MEMETACSWHIQNKFHVRKKELYPAATFDMKPVSRNEPHKAPKRVWTSAEQLCYVCLV